MTNIQNLIKENADRWQKMQLHSEKVAEFDATAKRLCEIHAKQRYMTIQDTTGVPWFVIAVIHERESSQKFNCQLSQGDPLDQVSVHEPAGRGPFLNHPNDPPLHDAFYRSALDALIDCEPHASKWKDWSIGGIVTILEEYNGLGYASMGVPSAYVWSGSNQYVSGKYVRDHVYSASAVDVQEGCAPIIARMMLIDKTIKLGSIPVITIPTPGKNPPTPVLPVHPKDTRPLWLILLEDLEKALGL